MTGFISNSGFWKRRTTETPFILSITVTAGQTFTLPLISTGSYDFNVEWGDGGSNYISTWDDTNKTHTYISGGTYDISITGFFNAFAVSSYSDRLKIIELKQWGSTGIIFFNFMGAANLTITATDVLDTSSFTLMSNMFRSCTSLTNVPNINLWDTSAVTNMALAFFGTNNLNVNLSGWNVEGVTNFGGNNFMTNTVLSPTNYDALLNGWSAQSVQSGITIRFGNSKYTPAGLVGRNILSGTYGWTITDGGPV